ncbi:MAG: outer membrane protein assembly factor BamD [Candidatus Acidiferrales bacterium]
MIKNRHCLIILLVAAMAGSLGASAYGTQKIKVIKEKHKKQKNAQSTNIESAAEPDKILYERALSSLKHSKYTEARLELQTLINTYPDSEYLAKAKLAIADSFYKEGGVGNLTQAIDAYKSFIVFFPFLDEAQYAQMQVAMCHYRMMLKSDRDPSEADSAEIEFQNFLLKYPQSPLDAKASQDLRNVQEVIADGEYEIGRFYYLKPDYPASAARLTEVVERYPLYSNSDDALWMLGNIYMIAKKYSKNEDDKNHWADYASKCYTRILSDYPLSEHAAGAKAELKSMGMPIPTADPHALARMEQDQRFEKKHHELFVMRWPKEILFSHPNMTDAAQAGQPNLNPPDDAISATDVLKRNAPGPVFTMAAVPATAANSDTPVGDAVPINAEPKSQVEDAPTTGVGAQIVSTGGADSASDSSTPAAVAPAATPAPAPAGQSVLSGVGSDTGTGAVSNSAAPGTAAAAPDPAPAASAPATSEAKPDQPAASSSSAAATTTTQDSAKPEASKNDSKTESSSKKKHGLHKIVPW